MLTCGVSGMVAGCLAVKKVRFDGNNEYQYIENFKLLQGAFNKKAVDKVGSVLNLVSCAVPLVATAG